MTSQDEDFIDSFDDVVLPWARKEVQEPVHHQEEKDEKDESCEYVRATSLADGREVRMALRPPFTADDAAAVLQEAGTGGPQDATWIQEALARCSVVDAKRKSAATKEEDETQTAAPHSFMSKYVPQAYGDLLTDEALNREVLRWLVAWRRGRVGDEHRCPVVVLAGPPGTGKTTLAHVLARQAGYAVVELNASDVRAGDAFARAVTDAVSSDCVLGDPSSGTRRPNLLLIDEIDGIASTAPDAAGAEHAPARVLAAMIEATLRARHTRQRRSGAVRSRNDVEDGEDDDENDDDDNDREEHEQQQQNQRQGKRNRRNKRGNKQVPVMRHPVICTCNDLYVPALRPLRRAATVLVVRRPDAARFLQILRRVCAAEHVAASASALTTLCELSGHDMRSALNTLEFVARSVPPGTLVTPATVQRAAAGTKDVAAATRDVCARILFPSPETTSASTSTTSNNTVTSLLAAVEETGETERVLEGCWLNYATLPAAQPDAGLHRCVACADALSQLDAGAGVLVARGAQRTLADTLWALAGVGYKVLGTDRCPPATASSTVTATTTNLTYPACHATMWRHRQALLSVAESFADALAPHARQDLFGLLPQRRRTAPPAAALEDELLPHVATLLHPHVRPVSRSLLRPAEQQAVADAASLMDSLGLAFRTATDPPPAHLVLDPFVLSSFLPFIFASSCLLQTQTIGRIALLWRTSC